MTTKSPRELKIVRYGHPALRQRSGRVGRVTGDVADLAERMAELMRAARGVGLAANQVGVPRRIAVVEIDGTPTTLIDPEIVSAEGEELAEEGCLSLPRLYGDVQRPTRVVVRARGLSGRRLKVEADGLLARALCHEMDHLNGRLFIDTVDEGSLHWLVGHTQEGEPIVQPTGLDDALKAFTAARRQER